MSHCEQDLSDDGLHRIRMQNRYLALSVLPEAGGKISELTDLGGGRNWLWQNPAMPHRVARYASDYGKALDSGGLDEILFSVHGSKLQLPGGRDCRIPDHGDVVGQQWSVDQLSGRDDGQALCRMSVAGRVLNYRFERAISLDSNKADVRLDYTLVNKESVPLPWYWCAHALTPLDPDSVIDLPGGQPFRVDDEPTRRMAVAVEEHAWPTLRLRNGRVLDLSRGFGDGGALPNFAAKVFVRSPASGTVRLKGKHDERLTWRYSPDDLPWLGLWINNRGWSGGDAEPYLNLGVEPATTPYDSLADALGHDSVRWIEPGSSRSWSVTVGVRA
jgi:galactose mutarotase-like enzyme